jgi:hypothetical protein
MVDPAPFQFARGGSISTGHGTKHRDPGAPTVALWVWRQGAGGCASPGDSGSKAVFEEMGHKYSLQPAEHIAREIKWRMYPGHLR